MATSVQDVHQASYPGYSDDYTITKSQLSATGTLSGSGLPPTIPTLPQLPPNEPRRNWVPDPCAPWVDPSAPQSSIRPRTLVLCFDGTGDQFDDDNSNVVQFVTALKKDDQRYQLVYYQSGIGTYTNKSYANPIMNKISKTLDEMFAWNLGAHVMEGYQFLMQNYTAGDKISLFGFSRGAFVARSLAGMITKVGLLPVCNTQQIPFAWAMYKKEDAGGWQNSEGFKKAFSIDVTIDFVGVWDTVASVGLIPRELPFVSNNTTIRVFRHAIALDEHRAKFMPNFYHSSEREQKEMWNKIKARRHGKDEALVSERPKKNKKNKKNESQLHEEAINAKKGSITDSKEVWFAGCHCDVGGGSVKNGTRYSLARIPLRWMIRECFATHTGIIFDADILRNEIGIDAATLYPVVVPRPRRINPSTLDRLAEPEKQGSLLWEFVKFVASVLAVPIKVVFKIFAFPVKYIWLLIKYSRGGKAIARALGCRHDEVNDMIESTTNSEASGSETSSISQEELEEGNRVFKSEEEEEFNDALSPEYDQLKIRYFWWLIEILPLRYRDQKGSRNDFFVKANLGKGRKIYGDARLKGLKIHRSVKTRIEVVDKHGHPVYRPRAWFKIGEPDKRVYVDDGAWNIDDPDSFTHWEWVD